ncbi:hypothetical protein [Winogradskyella sp. A2]|uniref:hypothetical protein n=1 Tax=Winogradskyella sp. A2 TaxID=3366944 RepID=UPI00398C6695
MKNLLLIFAFLFSVQVAFCQKFRLYPEMEITSLSSNESELTLMNGEILDGEMGLATVQTSSGLQRITSVVVFKKGEKNLKYKPKDIKEIKIKANWSDMSSSDANNDSSLQIKFYADMKSDYYIFRTVLDKKGKPRLMQLLNPGFDSNIQVYVDAKSKDSSIAGMLGKETAKSYYLTKGTDEKGIYVKKSKYKKLFPKIFGDCDAMKTEFGEKIKWGDFTQHIYAYDQDCK